MPQVTLGQLSDTRRNNFDFLRFFFASLVIFSHSYLLLTPDGNQIEPLSRATHMKMNFGSLAVAGFFAISGFLITQSWQRAPRLGDFSKKRALRIYPGWVVALLFCVLVAPVLRLPHSLALGDPATYRFFDQLLLHNSGVVKVLPGAGLPDGSTWTIPFEILCYGLVAALGLLGLFRRRVPVLALTVALLVFINWPSRTLLPTFGPTVPDFHLPYLGWLRCLPLFITYFLSGALFFLFRDRIPHSPWLLAAAALLVGLTLGDLPLAGLFFVVLPTAGFYALFYLAFLPLGGLHAWARRGDFSYGIYLYAYPIQRLLILEQFRGYHLSPLILFLAAWVLACLAAVLSWRLIERPALRLKPRSASPPMEQIGVAAEGA